MISDSNQHGQSLNKHYHDREETKNRNIRLGQRKINEVAGILNLRHGNVVDQALYYMNQIESRGLLKSKPLDAKVALVLFVSARANKKPKCLSEILRYLSATNSQVNSCLKKTMTTIFSNIDFRLNAEDIIEKIIYKLNLSEKVRIASKHTANKLKPFMEGKPPKTIAAVALLNVT
jgi:transcription initiation factor TFIIIB Brf1 subunit/transcription initiation factor TFIIB